MGQTYGEVACPVLTLDKYIMGPLTFTEHKMKASCLHLGSVV